MSTLITITYDSNKTIKYTLDDLQNKNKIKLSNIRSINVYSHNLNLNEINDDTDKTDIILPKVIIEIQEDNTEIKLFQNTAIKEIDTITINNPKYYKINLQNLFAGAKDFASIRIFQASNIVNCSGMFKNCKSLRTIPLLNTITVTDMSYMFYGSGISKIPNIDTSKVTNMSYMFANCTELENSPYLNTYNTTNLSHIFEGCTKLKNIPNMNTSKVEDMSYMLASCTKLESFPRLELSHVKKLVYMFKDCVSLHEKPALNISTDADTTGMFDGCSLTEEQLSNFESASTESAYTTSSPSYNFNETTETSEYSINSGYTPLAKESITDSTSATITEATETTYTVDTTESIITTDYKNDVLTEEIEVENSLSNSLADGSDFNDTKTKDFTKENEFTIEDNSDLFEESPFFNQVVSSNNKDNIVIENKYELALLNLVRSLVDGNHARADDVSVEKHKTSQSELKHLSTWRFYAGSSSERVNAGRNAPSGSIFVSERDFISTRDRYIREFSNSQSMLSVAFKNLNVSYDKGRELSDIGIFRQQAVTTEVCISCLKQCSICRGTTRVRCSSCSGSGKKRCSQCNGTGTNSRQVSSSYGGSFRFDTEYYSCTRCFGSGKVSCFTCLGRGSVSCGNCDGTGIMTHFFFVTGYANSYGNCTVEGSTEDDQLLNQYVSSGGDYKKFVESADFSYIGKSFPQSDTAIIEYSGTIETADLTFSIKGFDKEYRVLSFGTPAELFLTCNLYDDLFSKEIKYIKSLTKSDTSKRFYKNEFEKLEKYSLFKDVLEFFAANKQSRNAPNVDIYFYKLCYGCIKKDSAELLGFHASKILNSISATRNLFFTLISFCAVFAVFAVDDEHYFELNFNGSIQDIVMRYFWDFVKAGLIYLVLLTANYFILELKNTGVKYEYRQACRQYFFIPYVILFHFCVVASFTYGIFAHKGDVPAIGEQPYTLKKQYVDPYITEPATKAWEKSLDYGHTYVYIPAKKGIEKVIQEINERISKKSDNKSATDKRTNQNSKSANSVKNNQKNSKSVNSTKNTKQNPKSVNKGKKTSQNTKTTSSVKKANQNSKTTTSVKKTNQNSKLEDLNKMNNQK